jgi:hypothetical protein
MQISSKQKKKIIFASSALLATNNNEKKNVRPSSGVAAKMNFNILYFFSNE